MGGKLSSNILFQHKMNKKQLIVIMLILIASSNLLNSMDFGFGTLNIIKKKVEKIDEKVRERRAQELPDSVSPALGNIASSQISSTSAKISWTTNEPATSQVFYGTSSATNNSSPEDTAMISSHNVELTGLISETTYYYKVSSEDPSGNISQSVNYSFVTLPPPAYRTVQFSVDVPSGNDVYLVVTPFYSDHGNIVKQQLTQVSAGKYSASLQLLKNSLTAYYYEETTNGKEIFNSTTTIAYRFFHVTSSTANDIVAEWKNQSSAIGRGTLKGTVYDAASSPLMDATVSVNGVHAATFHDGTYIIKDVPSGQQRVTVTTTLGKYKTSTKIVEIQNNLDTTGVDFHLVEAAAVNVTFSMTPAALLPANARPRIIGNIYQLGAVKWYENKLDMEWTDRYVYMTESGGSYTASVDLYEGTFIQYIYTMGGNCLGEERNSSGDYNFREFIVNAQSGRNDSGVIFRPDGFNEYTFNVTVPANTPVTDTVFLKFGPAVAMNKVSDTNWTFTFYDYARGAFNYKYAHALQSEPTWEKFSGDDLNYERTATLNANTTQSDSVADWRWYPSGAYNYDYSMSTVSISTRTAFISGIYFHDYWTPNFLNTLDDSLTRLQTEQIEYNHIVLSSIWNYYSIDPPVLENRSIGSNIGSVDTPPEDMKLAAGLIKNKGGKIILYPQANSEMASGGENWATTPRNLTWINLWKEQMKKFYCYCARLCNDSGIDMMTVGTSNFQYADNNDKDSVNTWMKTELIPAIKTISPATKLVSMEYDYNEPKFNWYTEVDYLGINIWKNLELSSTNTVAAIKPKFDIYLDDLKSASTTYQKPFIATQFAYASVDGATNQKSYDTYSSDDGTVTLNKDEQARIYEAFFQSIAERNWFVGILPFGYSYIDMPATEDVSIRAKPAETVIKTYYPLFNSSVN